MKTETLKETIGKMLALAIDRVGSPEGDAAAAKALQLMAKHGLTEGDVLAEEDKLTRLIIDMQKNAWRYALLSAVGYLTSTFIATGGRTAWIIGRKGQVEIAEYMFESLCRQCQDAAHQERRRRAWKMSRWEGKTFRDSWVIAVETKISRIMAAQRWDSKKGSGGEATAMTLRSMFKEAEDFAEEQWKFTDREDRLRPWSAAGKEAGSNASLVAGVKGSSQKGLTA